MSFRATLRRGCVVGLAAGPLLFPEASESQLRLEIGSLEPTRIHVDRCAAGPIAYPREWTTALATSSLGADDAKVALEHLEDSLRVLVKGRSDDADLLYVLAAIVGMRAEREGGFAQVGAAKEALSLARSVLELEADHAGASHLVGRLHHEVLRMSRVKRFFVTRVLGAGALSGASWEEARRLLEIGVSGDPCRTDHHYDLARLYADRHEPALARERLAYLLAMPIRTPRDEVVRERAAALLARLDAGG